MRCWLRRIGSWIVDSLVADGYAVCAAPSAVLAGSAVIDAPHAESVGTSRNLLVPSRVRLGEECAGFVAGRYYELVGHRHQFPDWVSLNAVAHGDRADLERLAGSSGRANRRLAGLSYLAVEVLAVCDHLSLPLGRAQREVLVPYELELAVGAGQHSDLPGVIAAVRSRLESAARTARPDS